MSCPMQTECTMLSAFIGKKKSSKSLISEVTIVLCVACEILSSIIKLSTTVRRQNTLTLISGFIEESDFSDTSCNSAHVSDVQS